jgi:hypothetical protein
VNVSGLLLLFEGSQCRVVPIPDRASGLELGERLALFCQAVLQDDNFANCVIGLHEHEPGRCARR